MPGHSLASFPNLILITQFLEIDHTILLSMNIQPTDFKLDGNTAQAYLANTHKS